MSNESERHKILLVHDRGIYLRSPGAKVLAELHLLSAQWATRAMKYVDNNNNNNNSAK